MNLKGIPVSPGIALGTVFIYAPLSVSTEEQFIEKDKIKSEKESYKKVREKAAEEIQSIYAALQKEDPEKAKIFFAHKDILNDPAIEEEIIEGMETELWAGDWAIRKIYSKFIKMILKTKDPLIRERSADFEDVEKRLLRIWNGIPENNLSALSSPVIVAAKDLLPSDTATMDRRNVLAIITEAGSDTSHSAIIARSYEIPAVLGIPNLIESVREGSFAAVDAIAGEVILEPDEENKAQFIAKREKFLKKRETAKTFLKKELFTIDRERIEIGLNIGTANDEELRGRECTDFVGLFRTEFLYMGRRDLPGEDEQFEVYRKVLELYGKRPVVLRTLDIGGDKTLESMELPKEDNPFLGNRALRLCFSYPDIFKTQLRAALRASVFGNLFLMLPMVGSMDDIRRAKIMLEEVKAALNAEEKPYNNDYKLGIMIEIPSIALIADKAAQEVDFASLGTNDLCQYLNASDRMNSSVSGYFQTFHPAMFRLIGEVAASFNKAGKSLSVCGEMGGDPLAAVVLVGLGLRKLSMGLASVAPVKQMLSGLSIDEAGKIAGTIKDFSTAAEVKTFLEKTLEK